MDASDAALISAKEGIGIEEVLEGVVKYIPAPKGDEDKPLKALIFDSYYDSYKGVIAIYKSDRWGAKARNENENDEGWSRI